MAARGENNEMNAEENVIIHIIFSTLLHLLQGTALLYLQRLIAPNV